MKKLKFSISILLCMLLLLSSFSLPAGAAAVSDADAEKAITMFPGSDDSKRNFSWYAPADSEDCCVDISLSPDMSAAVCFEGVLEKTYQGDFSAKVTVSGLEENTEYYYVCNDGANSSEVYSFETGSFTEFSALLISDVHMSGDAEHPEELAASAQKLDALFTQANANHPFDIVLSSGDQANSGRRSEYTAFAANSFLKSVPAATALGNHDRGGVDYKYYNNVPNEYTQGLQLFHGGDYWFVKGSVLFMVFDSNNAAGLSHRSFVKEAVAANPGARWRVAIMHHDLYSEVIPSRENENRLLRALWTPIFDEFNVDLVLLGHSHYYSVSNVLYNGSCTETIENGKTVNNASGTVYMVSPSVIRPRGGELSYGDNIAIGADNEERRIYNMIDFSENELTVTGYDYSDDSVYSTFTLTKSADFEPQEANIFQKRAGFLGSALGNFVALFRNIGVVFDLREDGYELPLSEAFSGSAGK